MRDWIDVLRNSDKTLPDRGLADYYKKAMEIANPKPKDKTEYQWHILSDWYSCCDFETKEELEFLESIGWRWQDFVEESDESYEDDKQFYESLLEEV